MIAILDYGFGNLKSVWNALDALGEDPVVVLEGPSLDEASHLVIPGVGSYDSAMKELLERDLVGPLHAFAASGRPILGICLGMQLLGDSSEEGDSAQGLGLVQGKVEQFRPELDIDVPHAGWNTTQFIGEHPVFQGLPSSSDFYFVHSYRFNCDAKKVYGTTHHGEEFCSVIGAENVLGVQFHPEKSQRKGLRILENFCAWDGKC